MAGAERLELIAAFVERTASDVDVIASEGAAAAARLSQSADDSLVVYGAGALLHAFYTELEKLFQRIARDVDGGLPQGESWHTGLLEQMSIDVMGVRPPVISLAVQKRLHEYLRFRHLFRNLYVLDLDPGELRRLLDTLPAVWVETRDALRAFGNGLRAIASGLRQQ